MSLQQYNSLMSNLLKEKRALTKLREKLKGRKGKMCRSCKEFGHLACNCRNTKEGEKRTTVPQNKFEVLGSRVMQYEVEEKMIRRHEVVVVECFKCGEKGHKYREYPLWEKKERVAHVAKSQKAHQQKGPVYPVKGKVQEGEKRLRRVEEEEEACMAKPREAQQEWRRSSIKKLRKRVEEHCSKGVPEEAQLLELGWYTPEMIVIYNECRGCERKGSYAEDNRGQGVLQDRKLWCGCQGKGKERAVWPRKTKAQQSGTQTKEPESAAREGGSQREVRRTFKILREVWLNIGVEKLDTYEGITIKALLDSGATGVFMNKRMAARHVFKLQKLERPIIVRNMDGTNNSGGAITHQVEVNMYYKGHVERIRIDICDLEKTEIILGML